MTTQMPRGAIPAKRSEIAATEPFVTTAAVPSGSFPSPASELAGAMPWRPTAPAPDSFFAWPVHVPPGGDTWAEEAFAKACAAPRVRIPDDAVRRAADACGDANFAAFMQTRGFEVDGRTFRDGPFRSIAWTDEATLHAAIAFARPVKIGLPKPVVGASGWVLRDLPAGPGDHCASLFGFGSPATLVDAFRQHGIHVELPADMPAGPCYAMFAAGSIGIVDRRTLIGAIGEAWVRVPTTLPAE